MRAHVDVSLVRLERVMTDAFVHSTYSFVVDATKLGTTGGAGRPPVTADVRTPDGRVAAVPVSSFWREIQAC